MSHFAELNENNIVIRVLVGDDNKPNEGKDWFENVLGGRWVQTSYNTYAGQHLTGGTPLRKNFAAIGFTYDEQRDAFIPPQPFESWILDEETCLWDAPIPHPNDGKQYQWDEPTLSWLEIGA